MQSTKYDIPIFEDEDIADLNSYSKKMANALEKQIDKFGSPLIYSGEVETFEDLDSVSDVKKGEIYTILDENKNYIFNGTDWIEYSSQINLEKVQLSKIYKASHIIAKTIEGVGRIHKLYGKPEGTGTTGTIEIISTKANSTSLKTINCKSLYCIKNNIGNIIAQDYIDFDRQKIVRQCGYITFDGSNDEDWVADTRNNRFFIAKPVDCLRSEIGNCTSICNRYELNNTETVDESYNIGASIYVKDLSCSDLASFKQSLASNPMILIVALNTSYEEDIDCTCGITQYEGETTIYNTEGAELEVELTNNKAICSANESIVNLQKEKISKLKNKVFKVNIDSTYIGKAELNQVIRNGNVCRVDLRCEIIADIPNSTTFATLPFLPELSITFMLGLGGHYTINTPKWGFAGTNGEIQSNPITKGQYMHIAFTYICKD